MKGRPYGRPCQIHKGLAGRGGTPAPARDGHSSHSGARPNASSHVSGLGRGGFSRAVGAHHHRAPIQEGFSGRAQKNHEPYGTPRPAKRRFVCPYFAAPRRRGPCPASPQSETVCGAARNQPPEAQSVLAGREPLCVRRQVCGRQRIAGHSVGSITGCSVGRRGRPNARLILYGGLRWHRAQSAP